MLTKLHNAAFDSAGMTTAQEKPLYPSAEALLTARDASVIHHYREMLWQLEFRTRHDILQDEKLALVLSKLEIEGGHPVINPHHAHLRTIADVEDAKAYLDNAAEELTLESEELHLTTLCAVFKRDGYLAGIKHAMAALRSGSPEQLATMLQALSDDEQADQSLHEFTKHQADPGSGSWEEFFPQIAPVAAAKQALAACEQAAKLRAHLESAEAALPDDPRRTELEAAIMPFAKLPRAQYLQAVREAGISENNYWKMKWELDALRKPVCREDYRVSSLREKLHAMLKRAGGEE